MVGGAGGPTHQYIQMHESLYFICPRKVKKLEEILIVWFRINIWPLIARHLIIGRGHHWYIEGHPANDQRFIAPEGSLILQENVFVEHGLYASQY